MYDLIIIGAGVNGAGIARDAALNGLKVLVLDKEDVASGTSATSTRLIHGGLRYLEYGEVHLVRESLREREILLRQAPHLVKPLPLLIPIYEGAKRGPLLVWLGMLAYDILSFDKSVDHHHMLSRKKLLKRFPGVAAQGLRGAALYYDCQVDYAERLVVENMLSALYMGVDLKTYTNVEELSIVNGVCQGVLARTPQGELVRYEGRVVMNVAGPWVDKVLTGGGSFPRLMGGTKGSHLVVKPFPGVPQDGLYVEAQADGRPFFIVPWNDLVLIGTTDLRTDEDLDALRTSGAEVDYLLREANLVIPGAGLTPESVLYTYTGVRPLPYVAEGKTAGITRRHLIINHAPAAKGLYSIVGGKLTTYRSLAEQATDTVLKALKLKRRDSTRKRALPGCTNMHLPPYRDAFRTRHGLSDLTAAHLLKVYGQRAEEVLALASGHPDLKTVLCEESGTIAAEIVMALGPEKATTLTDIFMRRTMTGFAPSRGLGAAEAAARVAQQHCGWTPEHAAREVDRYRDYCTR